MEIAVSLKKLYSFDLSWWTEGMVMKTVILINLPQLEV